MREEGTAMLGLGTWRFFVDTMFYRGDAKIIVSEKDGAYEVDVDIPVMDDMPPFSFSNLEADGDTLTGTALVDMDMVRGKEIPFSVTFDGDSASGFLKVPFLGKIKLNNGVRVA
jgi:hypothetical protein